MNNNDTLPISIFLDYINKLDKEHYYLSDKYYLRIKKGILYFTIERYTPKWKRMKEESVKTIDFSDIGIYFFYNND